MALGGKHCQFVGGPLCGEVASGIRDAGIEYEDADGRVHYYRLMIVRKDDRSSSASYYHYFGTNRAVADLGVPTLRPPKGIWRKKKRL